MAEEEAADNSQVNPTPPVPTGLPINWGLITGPVPEPIFPQSSAVFALQTKTKGRGRLATEVQVSSPVGQISSEVPLRPRPRGKGLSLPRPSWRTGTCKDSSSSDEEEEVEVQVRLEIHSPPSGVKAEQEKEETNSKENQDFFLKGKPYCLGEGTSQESLLSDNSSSSKDDPSPPRPQCLTPSTVTTATSSPSTSSSSTRRWAPPKGFWRVARPETLLLNRVGPHNIPASLPVKDYTQIETLQDGKITQKIHEAYKINDENIPVNVSDTSAASKHSDSVECCLNDYEQKQTTTAEPKRLDNTDHLNTIASQSVVLSAEDKESIKQRAYSKLRERQKYLNEEREQCGGEVENIPLRFDYQATVAHEVLDNCDSAIIAQDLEPYLRSLIVISDELPLSPRHEHAKCLLERARLKARSCNIEADRPGRRSHSDQRSTVKKQPARSPSPPALLKMVQTKEDLPVQTVSAPVFIPAQRDTSPTEQSGRYKRYGCSPTRVRFEDESEKEAESRYLDRMRQRGRPGMPKSKMNEVSTDSSSSGSERSRGHRNISMSMKQEDPGANGEITTVVKEIIVLVKKCESCGSVVREPQPVSSASDPQNTEQQLSGKSEDPRLKTAFRGANKSEASTRPKAPLTVTFAGAFVLGGNKENSTGWKPSGFGKLRRRSRKGESRLESGHGPYGPSWAQRRNSNPRNRINVSRGVSFAPGSPVALEPNLLESSSGIRDSSTPSLPIKSALKSSSRNRSATSQPTVQFQITSDQGGEGGCPSDLHSQETRRECQLSLTQGTPATNSSVACIRPSTLRYSPARLNTELPTPEMWDAASAGAGVSADITTGSECRALRGLAMFRDEDLRAELLRAEHLKAEAIWGNTESYRKLDGRPKLFLRRFFSSIGLNSVGRLVKGGRSSSMEQLSLPAAPRASSASPSPTRRPQPSNRIQRTPSLQSLHTVLPLAQLRKAASVQSLERRTERSTILGEVQIPYGLAPSPDSPRLELHRALSVENVLVSRMVRPVGRVTQTFPDGTLLLELIKPPNGPFGFVISRGKGRPDTGVYVEKVGDGSSEGPYLGLLSIGDEILQVNGEVVAGLTLDQVTRLMTRESTASLRIMPARRSQR